MKSEDSRLLLGRKAMTNLDGVLKSRDNTLLTKVCLVKAMVFPVVSYGCESWTVKKAEHQRIDAFELWCWRRFLGQQGDQTSQSYGKSTWIIFGRTDAEAGASILWPPDVNSLLTGKDSDAGKDWRKKEKRATEDEIVGWYHLFNGHEFEQTPGDDQRQGSPVHCSPWGHKESDTAWPLKNNRGVCVCWW